MNKNFLEHYMKTKPETNEQKYHTVNSLIEYMDEIACTGTYQMDYVYVPACYSKKMNDSMEQYFQNNYLTFRKGWYLFKEKEYLAKPEHFLQIKAIISDFIKRFEGQESDQPDLNKFHKFNEQGKRIGVFDMEIVDYLIQTVPFFMLGSTPDSVKAFTERYFCERIGFRNDGRYDRESI